MSEPALWIGRLIPPIDLRMTAWRFRGSGQRGFTLIELMIVVAIIALLAALSVPFYQSFTTRAKVSEGLVLLAPVKTAVVEYHAVHGGLPTSSNWLTLLRELGLPVSAEAGAASGGYVKRIWWNSAEREIRIRYGVAPIDDKVLYLQADIDGSSALAWRCYAPEDDDGVPREYLPSSCRG